MEQVFAEGGFTFRYPKGLSASASTGRDSFLHIGAHPELLSDEVMEVFETLFGRRSWNAPKMTRD
jgi:hypothetical protein